MSKKQQQLAYFLEDIWSKGFRLTDEDVRFIYFGKSYADLPEQLVIIAVKATLQFQHRFDGSFYISLLDFFREHHIQTKREAWELLEQKGFIKKMS